VAVVVWLIVRVVGQVSLQVLLLPLIADVLEDLLDAVAAFHRFVEEELELGYTFQPQPAADVTPKERRCPPERAFGFPPGLRISERGVVHTSALKVWGHLDVRNREEPDARVVKLACHEIRNLAAELIRNTLRS
jgi:hypothetical protein